ncbi:dynein light chain 1, axonemal [Pimephales promelas]|nr:dynein light chain 1, axonemal [Pimephales promelas]
MATRPARCLCCQADSLLVGSITLRTRFARQVSSIATVKNNMAKATTIKEALVKWEEKTGEKASEATAVKLYGQIPPVEKMDASLSNLTNCERYPCLQTVLKNCQFEWSKRTLRYVLGANYIKTLMDLRQ